MPPRELSEIRACTFDCFGTLIDWSSGILDAWRPLASQFRASDSEAQLLEEFGRLERQAEAGPFRNYRAVLRLVTAQMFPDASDLDLLSNSLATWRQFSDTADSLAALSRNYRLGVLSNIDDDLFQPVLERLGHPFEIVVTASQVKSYKPRDAHFRESLRRLGVHAHQVLHVAESRFHDIEPARRLGFRTVWVDRGRSASGQGEAVADLSVRSLAELVERLDV